MLTEKDTYLPQYWTEVFLRKNKNSSIDNLDLKVETSFSRHERILDLVEGKSILDIGSGHATLAKHIRKNFPDINIIASDFCEEARGAANFTPFCIFPAEQIPFCNKFFDLCTCTQVLEYVFSPYLLVEEMRRIAKKGLFSVPLGEIPNWGQQRIFLEQDFFMFLEKFGEIENFNVFRNGHIIIAKIKFYDI